MMKNICQRLIFLALLLSCAFFCSCGERSAYAEDKKVDVEKKIAELGIKLTKPSPPTANFVRAVRSGNLVFLAGHGPAKPGGGYVQGKVPSEGKLEQAQEAAKFTAVSLLSSLKAEIGDLNKVKRIVKVFGMVNADASFTQHSQVINGCSDLLVKIYGERGKHARAAVGMSSLPFNIAVEIEMIVEVED